MTAARPTSARFRLAPVAAGGAAWDDAVDLVLAPMRLSSPVRVVIAPSRRGGAR